MYYRHNYYPSKEKPDIVRPVYVPLRYYDPVTYSQVSRYAKYRCLRTKHDIHPNKFIPQSFEKSRSKEYHETRYNNYIYKDSADKYIIVDNRTFNRLDVIANRYYGSPSYWWVIAKANANCLFDPFNIPIGTSLRLPAMTSIFTQGGGVGG